MTFLYDVENRLVKAMGAKQATLTYDPLGRLWEVDGTAGGGLTTRFLYDGDALVAEYDEADNLNHRYVHGVGTDVPAPSLRLRAALTALCGPPDHAVMLAV